MTVSPTRPSLRILALGDVPAELEQIVLWYRDAWPDWYGPSGPGDARRDLDRCIAPAERLPRCLVALGERGLPVGTVSLRDTSPGSDRYRGAWLTALFVPENFRRTGIGTELIAAAETEAQRLEFPNILTATATAQSIILRRDWQQIDTLQSVSGPLGVYHKALGAV
jgi:GNAT superfamily N-acetyltransferase